VCRGVESEEIVGRLRKMSENTLYVFETLVSRRCSVILPNIHKAMHSVIVILFLGGLGGGVAHKASREHPLSIH